MIKRSSSFSHLRHFCTQHLHRMWCSLFTAASIKASLCAQLQGTWYVRNWKVWSDIIYYDPTFKASFVLAMWCSALPSEGAQLLNVYRLIHQDTVRQALSTARIRCQQCINTIKAIHFSYCPYSGGVLLREWQAISINRQHHSHLSFVQAACFVV